MLAVCAAAKKKARIDGRLLYLAAAFLLLSGAAGYQFYDKSAKVLSADNRTAKVSDEVNLYEYLPFNAGNKLAVPGVPPSLAIASDYPRLDGATAAYPVYAAMAQAIYKGLDSDTVTAYVACSTTDAAYTRLINGEADIFFGAQPSRQELDLAASKGVELSLTPVAKEAFVFFVNAGNPVDSLTLEQIENIYRKKTVNWRDVGGPNERIMPFQRPENSGSQTIMLAKVMNGEALPPPLMEEYSGMMGGMIRDVAAYRNYASAIGYSFRFYVTAMNPDENIKLLAINGIEPSPENIRNGTYPFTVDVYAVTAGTANPNTAGLLAWTLSAEGQAFVEKCGYSRY